MFILKSNQKRCNPYAPFTDEQGTQHIRMPASLYDEVPEPVAPVDYSDDYYYRTEQDDAPYVVYTRKSDEQIAQVVMAKAKVQRTAEVEAIKVTTVSGKEFDGDEISQGRMARAILALELDNDETLWVLANNVPTMVTRGELREALRLAGAAQAAVWTTPYHP